MPPGSSKKSARYSGNSYETVESLIWELGPRPVACIPWKTKAHRLARRLSGCGPATPAKKLT